MIEINYSREIIFKKWVLLMGILILALIASSLRAGAIPFATEFLLGCGILVSGSFFMKGIRRKPQVIINGEGINDLRLGLGTVPWSAIKSHKFYRSYGARLLLLSLDSPREYTSKLSFFWRIMSKWYSLDKSGDIVVDMTYLRVVDSDISSIMKKYDQSADA